MIIEHDMTTDELVSEVINGRTYFYRIDFSDGIIENKNFDNLIFIECMMCIKFVNSTLHNTKFINSNIKTCMFCESDLTNMVIEDCSVESVVFESSILDGVVFNMNYCYNKVQNQGDLFLYIK